MEKRLFKVYYKRNPLFTCLNNLTVKEVTEGYEYVFLRDLFAQDLEGVFYKMQGEIWSPNGEAMELIKAKGLHHTSLSVGDVVYDVDAGIYWQADMCGWKEIRS